MFLVGFGRIFHVFTGDSVFFGGIFHVFNGDNFVFFGRVVIGFLRYVMVLKCVDMFFVYSVFESLLVFCRVLRFTSD